MENYPSNSQKAKSEGDSKAVREKKIEQITVGTVTRRKRPLGKRFTETFGGGDAQGVMVYILQDVLMPAAKDMISDAVSQGVEKMLFGEARGPSRRPGSNSRGGGYTSYNRYSVNPGHRREPEPRREMSRGARASHNFDEIILDSRAEADEVLSNLFASVEEYGTATVSDLYSMVGQTGSFQDERWGWDDMRGSSIARVKGGYLLDLPKPIYID